MVVPQPVPDHTPRPQHAPRARGSAINPANRYESLSLDVLPHGGGDDDLIHEESGPEMGADGKRRVATRVYRDHSRSVINPVDSPDLNFHWSINPYRGCEHGCIYCYARPTHENLGLSCGLDFETKIFAKVDAPAILRRELARPSWKGEPIMMAGVTDVYQPVERTLRVTRGILELFAAHGQPVAMVTKSALVLRDIELLASMARKNTAKVAVSLTTLDPELSMQMEPRGAAPAQRLRVIRELTAAGVPVAVLVAPVIPAITDREMPKLLEAAAEAGATGAGYVLLRLPYQVKEVFFEWLERRFPQRSKHVESLIRQTHEGELYRSQFKTRQVGRGAFAEQIKQTFALFTKRYGLDGDRSAPLSSAHFTRPEPDAAQLGLFG